MARKRRTRYHWFLNTGTGGPSVDVEDDHSYRDIAFTVPADGTTALQIVDLVEDTASEDTVGQPIAVTTANDYFIKRIVGKLFLGLNQGTDNGPRNVICGAGFFVARAGDSDDAAGAQNLPIGDAADHVNNYSPLRLENIREPWIWRRTWVFGNAASTSALAPTAPIYPKTTAEYGSVLDGPHVDAKTARRIRDGERLFLVVAARTFRPNFSELSSGSISGIAEYRVLGAPRKSRNRSAF